MDDTDITKASFRKEIEQQLMTYMQGNTFDSKLSGVYNQALMELGATVCVPNGAPYCGKCPWQELCQAYKAGRMMEFPVKKKAKTRRIEKRTVFVIRDGERVIIRKRPSKGLLAGLYEFPNLPGELSPEEIITAAETWGLQPEYLEKTVGRTHIFTHITWNMTGARLHCGRKNDDFLWVSSAELRETYALPTAFRQFLQDF